MRHYSSSTAAHALGVDRKFLDNFLVRDATLLVSAGRRGKSRRISFATLEQLALALVLNRDLGVPLAKGAELAAAIVSSPRGEIPIGTLGALRFDSARLRAPLEAALAVALEEVTPPRRGRPPAVVVSRRSAVKAEQGAS